MKYFNTILFCLIGLLSFAQSENTKSVKVLFIGNSYIYFNNLPQICTGIAASVGDVLITDHSTFGGYSFKNHFEDSNTLNKIIEGPPDYNNTRARSSWDYVILQEQSRFPSYPPEFVQRNVFLYAKYLDSTIHKFNPLAKTVFFMTWGRKNGDTARCSTWQPVCSYKGMDSLLAMNYTIMAKRNNALLSPVGAVWKYLRENYPSIELYNSDESHPSEAGSYAAACCFYTVLFNKDPTLIKFDYTLNHSIASNIRSVVKQVVYDKLSK